MVLSKMQRFINKTLRLTQKLIKSKNLTMKMEDVEKDVISMS